jgi:hypothetical protein
MLATPATQTQAISTLQSESGTSMTNASVYDAATLWMGWTTILVPLMLLVSFRLYRTTKDRRYHRQIAYLERIWQLSITPRQF